MTIIRNVLAASAALSLVAAPVAVQAQSAPSFLTSSTSTKAFRLASTMFCPQNSGDCVLPLPDAAPPAPTPAPPVVQAPPAPAAPAVVEPVAETGGGLGIFAALLAAAAIAGGLVLLMDDDEDDLPTSP